MTACTTARGYHHGPPPHDLLIELAVIVKGQIKCAEGRAIYKDAQGKPEWKWMSEDCSTVWSDAEIAGWRITGRKPENYNFGVFL